MPKFPHDPPISGGPSLPPPTATRPAAAALFESGLSPVAQAAHAGRCASQLNG